MQDTSLRIMGISRTLGAWRSSRGRHSGSPQRWHQLQTFKPTRTRAQSSTVRQCDAPTDRCPACSRSLGRESLSRYWFEAQVRRQQAPGFRGLLPRTTQISQRCAHAPQSQPQGHLRQYPFWLLLRFWRLQHSATPSPAAAFCCCRPKRPNAPPAAPPRTTFMACRRVTPVANDFESESNR